MMDNRVVVVVALFTVCILGFELRFINGATDASDTSALNTLFTSMYSPAQLTQWTASAGDPCGQNWGGVTCSGTGVTQIKLSGLELSGTLGYMLDSLTFLTELDLSSNNLGGDLPYQLPPNPLRLLYLKGKYSTEGWLQSEKKFVKDALKVLVLDPRISSLSAKSDTCSETKVL